MYILGRTVILGRWVLVLVGLLQPLDPVSDQNFTRTGEITTMKWAKLPPSLRRSPFYSHHPLEVYIRENIYTLEMGAGLGWVAATSGSLIGAEVY
jgi:hypothetical protein